MRAGEWYDARQAIDGWNLPGFDDSAWASPLSAKPPRGILRDADIDPIIPQYELAPISKPTASRVFSNTVLTMDICRKAAALYRAMDMAEEAAYCETLQKELRTSARRYLLNLDTITAIYRCQTAQAMAIHYGLFEPAEARLAFDELLKLIDENGGSFDCGIFGLRVIFHVLSRFGRSDLAFNMITKPDFPSYSSALRYTISSESFTIPME